MKESIRQIPSKGLSDETPDLVSSWWELLVLQTKHIPSLLLSLSFLPSAHNSQPSDLSNFPPHHSYKWQGSAEKVDAIDWGSMRSCQQMFWYHLVWSSSFQETWNLISLFFMLEISLCTFGDYISRVVLVNCRFLE